MRQYDEHDKKNRVETLHSTLMIIAFGLTSLAFVIAIDRPEWFHIRPISGTAVAMSMASGNNSTVTPQQQQPEQPAAEQ